MRWLKHAASSDEDERVGAVASCCQPTGQRLADAARPSDDHACHESCAGYAFFRWIKRLLHIQEGNHHARFGLEGETEFVGCDPKLAVQQWVMPFWATNGLGACTKGPHTFMERQTVSQRSMRGD